MTEMPASTRRFPLAWLLLVVALAAVGVALFFGWRAWQGYQSAQLQAAEAQQQRWDGTQQMLETLRRDQRLANERLADAAATNRVLRDEMLGLSQRSALLEETVQKLADPNRHGAQALRLDEVELLLRLGQQRLSIAGDADGARRAYALANAALNGIDDPGYLNLRQALVQERDALDRLGAGPQAQAGHTLDQLAGDLLRLPEQTAKESEAAQPWWQKALTPLVDIRPSRGDALLTGGNRHAARDALQIEVSLARAAAERGDAAGFAQSLRRVDTWTTRLWPDSPQRRQARTRLRTLQQAPLRPRLPELGTTLLQLQAMREGRSTQ
ncbi:uroporphyrinogen-III C-methyltransferase [Xanthomonas arboricola pv. corylina]|uniref:Uroporphyrin-III methyltransferase n=3 Tax=Xanthomonas arboricola TaxID=56448 RepID=A0AAP0WJ27_9XANT|nr:uroporphyrinogen-III C-methyltransferase [Xanthomonas arboricola]AKU51594.1 uroporphyrin-III methyltransferase [Xanthomonas arboricola pv. juglandis]KER81228.1 uroporphyrin-III methyltransferase [Xanthomonas arboricola pv. celebensis]KOA99145.1 uroporphyrin-III methyltransferase [Xanthomonas arboricola]KOB02830.1 uroporphyrin-III methyltransferase [Xanthomonas arboricola]KOB09905.1 uroporphyrin-III methyltransferase [Xanthomonas arboricola]